MSDTPSKSDPRRLYDVAILSGTTPFVITCQEAQAYKSWESSLRYAVQEYKTWSSFRRGENVMNYFKSHVGESVRFLKGVEGARNDLEACWEEMRETEIMKISKETFQNIEKACRKVVNWHGVADQKIIRTKDDVAFLPNANSSTFATECRASEPFSLWENAIRKAVLKYKKSWENFRRSGGVNCYFWNELGDERRMLRARNESATSDDDADWEVLCGEPLTSFMEKQFKYYACVLEEPEEETPAEKEKPKDSVQSDDSKGKTDEGSAAKTTDGKVSELENETKKRRLEEEEETEQQSKKRAKPNNDADVLQSGKAQEGISGNDDVDGLERGAMAPLPSRKLVCSVFLLTKSLGIPIGRIDTKLKTKWRLDRVRNEIDPVLRRKNFLTQKVPWEFYFPNSGSFVSQAFEDRLRVDEYLAEAGEDNSISIRVVL